MIFSAWRSACCSCYLPLRQVHIGRGNLSEVGGAGPFAQEIGLLFGGEVFDIRAEMIEAQLDPLDLAVAGPAGGDDDTGRLKSRSESIDPFTDGPAFVDVTDFVQTVEQEQDRLFVQPASKGLCGYPQLIVVGPQPEHLMQVRGPVGVFVGKRDLAQGQIEGQGPMSLPSSLDTSCRYCANLPQAGIEILKFLSSEKYCSKS